MLQEEAGVLNEWAPNDLNLLFFICIPNSYTVNMCFLHYLKKSKSKWMLPECVYNAEILALKENISL